MSEELHISGQNRQDKYIELIPQIKAIIGGEKDLIANLANVAAAIKQTFAFLWVGFYLVKDKELVLGPFQGPIACTRIAYGRGVCGTAWKEKKVLIVPNVEDFPGHIACSSNSKSEIVLPLVSSAGDVWGVLDLDSENLNDFSSLDQNYLAEILSNLKDFSQL